MLEPSPRKRGTSSVIDFVTSVGLPVHGGAFSLSDLGFPTSRGFPTFAEGGEGLGGGALG